MKIPKNQNEVKRVRSSGLRVFNVGGRGIFNKTISRIIGFIMLIIAVIFVVYALAHPEASVNLPLPVMYVLYVVYAVAMIIFIIAPFNKKRG